MQPLSLPLQELEEEGSLRQSESHYVEAGEWKTAVHMYRKRNLWDDAHRVSERQRGGGGGKGGTCRRRGKEGGREKGREKSGEEGVRKGAIEGERK